jgi:hypothetical protein
LEYHYITSIIFTFKFYNIISELFYILDNINSLRNCVILKSDRNSLLTICKLKTPVTSTKSVSTYEGYTRLYVKLKCYWIHYTDLIACDKLTSFFLILLFHFIYKENLFKNK